MKHLISLNDLSKQDFEKIIDLSIKLKSDQKSGIQNTTLKNKTLGMIFSKSSTRTRVSFEVGMYQLGGNSLFLSSQDIQLGRGESIYDTAKVLSRYIDGIMIRTFNHSDVEDLAKFGTIPVINGLTDLMHPCQILADMLTIYEVKGKFEGLKLAYIGDGNNVTHSLLHGCTKVGMHIAVASPKGYECNKLMVDEAINESKKSGSNVLITNDPIEAALDADIVYTDTWISMGQESEKAERIKIFKDYQINSTLFSKCKKDAMFLHCLPAYRGYEVTSEIIDGPNSYIFDEAENRLHAQKAVMSLLMG